ncbi:MAG: DUF4389 domain-containing protein [Deltaproteobacteria bacterium]|nr:DUF4389 domain-containing protein [Deltaproteobacteria bacterium]
MQVDYPVHVEVETPAHFERIQLLLRLALAIALGWVGVTAGWLVCTLYAALPVVAAIAISSGGGSRYRDEVAPRIWQVLRWLLQFSAYMSLLVDRFPTDGDVGVDATLRPTGTPSIGSALLRLLTSIPSGLVLCVLWFISGILWVIAAVIVLLGGDMPPSIAKFQRGVLRWSARLVAYHASLVEEYPPFAFETDDGHGTPLTAGSAP